MTDKHRYLAIGTEDIEINLGGGRLDDDSLNMFIAALKGSGSTGILRLDRDFIQGLLDNAPVGQDILTSLADLIPDGFGIEINSALLLINRKSSTNQQGQKSTATRFLLGASFGVNLNLSALPLVDKVFPPNQTLGMDNFQVILSSAEISEADTTALKGLVPDEVISLPKSIKKGPNLSADLYLGTEGGKEPLKLDLSLTSSTEPAPATGDGSGTTLAATTAPTLTKPGYIKWLPVNKTFGPVTFHRIGGRYNDNSLYFLLDAQMAVGPLTITLNGLSVGSSLEKFKPEFSLDGIGLSYNSGQVSISGAFLRDGTDNSFSGIALIRTPSLSLSALGSYREINGQPSIFVYAVLNLAVGVGPAFLQVTGIAAGFGYNRRLNIPPIDNISEFPLVSAALNAGTAETDPVRVLESTRRYIPASSGDLFFAMGIRFRSFRMLDCFALLILTLGNRNRLHLLGLGRMTVPAQPGTSTLIQSEIAIKAFYDFDNGELKVEGRLTPASFLYSRDCYLTGGFAFYSWFDGPNAGDFVFTMGGYHPRYKKPSHYPNVPRLGFQWQLASNLSIKGSMYCALVPGTLMAGGSLVASFESPRKTVGFDIGIAGASLTGQIYAAFTIGADFLIAWQPFYYEADIYLSIGVRASFEGYVRFLGFSKSVRKDFNLSLSAGLSVKGPEFSGSATVNWNIVSFTINFGRQRRKPPKLTWNQFRAGFLPADDAAINSLAVVEGLSRELEDKRQVINPAELVLGVDSVIPLTSLKLGTHAESSGNSFHVASMGDAAVTQSELTITIMDMDNGDQEVSGRFKIIPVTKSAPAALWGTALNTGLNSKEPPLLKGLLMGCQIVPAANNDVGQTEERPVSDFSYDVEYSEEKTTLLPANLELKDISENITWMNINSDPVSTARKELLAAAGITTETISVAGLAKNGTSVFLVEPKQVTLAA